jgi:hypothetical protein
MTLENVHPDVVTRVQGQLPEGYKLVSAHAESETQAIFVVEKDGLLKQASMPKASLLLVLKNRTVETLALEGEPLNSVILELADKYKLSLLPGVDFNVEDDVVAFNGQDSYEVMVPILKDSVSLTGALLFTIRDRNKQCVAPERATFELEQSRVRLALSGQVFKETEGDSMSAELSERVATFVNGLGFKLKLKPEELEQAEVLSRIHDGISSLFILKLSSGLMVPVRYSS